MINELPFILVVDDQDAARYGVTRTLEHAGFTVLEGATGRDCLRLAHLHEPQVIILDVRLPDLDGFEVCRRIKADPATSSTAVLLISAELMESEHKAEGLDCGADIYLSKPVSPRELVSTVKALLRTHEAEYKAQRLARQWKVTFEAMSGGIALLDAAGMVQQCNGALAGLLGRGPEAVAGEDFFAMLQQTLGFDGRNAWNEMNLLRRRQSVEFVAGEQWFSLDFEPILESQARPFDAVCILSCITARKVAEENLRLANQMLVEADRRRNRLLAIVAHELRGPLAPIRYALQIMDQAHSRKSMTGKHREIIDRQLNYMSRLLEDLLDVTLIREGKLSLNKEIVDLREILDRAVEALQPQIEERRHELIQHCSEEPLWLEGDRIRLEQIVRNLLGNAIKYTQSGGRIELILEREDSSDEPHEPQALLRVRDNGVGIAPEMLLRVFDQFSQAGRLPEQRQGGLGMGLAIVRSLAQLHGGVVEAHSKGVGMGSEFVVRMPLSVESRPAVPPPADEGRQEHAIKTKLKDERIKIMIVDDNKDAVEGLEELLTLWGYDAKGIHSGSEAIQGALLFQPDLILLDIGLPGMDGFEVSRRLRQEPSLEGVMIIAMTGYGREADRCMAAESGFDQFLVKPVDLARLRQFLAQVAMSRE